MAEWTNAAALKAAGRKARRFESCPFRQRPPRCERPNVSELQLTYTVAVATPCPSNLCPGLRRLGRLRSIDIEPRPATSSIEIRLLADTDELHSACQVLRAAWGSANDVVHLDVAVAVRHSGGYVAGAFEGDTLVGASLGLLARHDGRPTLHSHITGLLDGFRHAGIGRRIKLHQRAWALDHDIHVITWTFDPLVRRNAWFNIAVLGADVADYLPAFYGTMTDTINAGDESDRLLMHWDLDPAPRSEPRDAIDHLTDADVTLVPTPADIVELRRTDLDAVARWRSRTREALIAAITAGRPVIGFTRGGDYVIGSAP